MHSLIEGLARSSGTVLLVLILAVLALSLFLIGQHRAATKVQTRMRRTTNGYVANISAVGSDIPSADRSLEERLSRCEDQVGDLLLKMRSAKRYVGLIRYDAFQDVSGTQSFALALIDEMGDGVLISSVVSRADCRVYCKRLMEWGSDRSLTSEERDAVRAAQERTEEAIYQ